MNTRFLYVIWQGVEFAAELRDLCQTDMKMKAHFPQHMSELLYTRYVNFRRAFWGAWSEPVVF